jgi:hypothetical protein
LFVSLLLHHFLRHYHGFECVVTTDPGWRKSAGQQIQLSALQKQPSGS